MLRLWNKSNTFFVFCTSHLISKNNRNSDVDKYDDDYGGGGGDGDDDDSVMNSCKRAPEMSAVAQTVFVK
jgi:hypothetical protein